MNCSELLDINSTSISASLYVKVTGTALFVIVWPFIVLDMSFFPLGRPAAALVGATLMVIFKIVLQEEVYEIEGDVHNLTTIFLLVGMMMLSYYFDREGLLNVLTLKIFGKDKPFHSILWKVCIMSALLSAFITNDAACLVITPLLMTEFMNQGRDEKELLPLCLGIATSANIGSASTFFGNPQNAFIASQTGVELLQFFIAELPAALLGMAINIGALYLFHFIRQKICCNKGTTKQNEDNERTNLLDSSNSNEVVSPFTSLSQERSQFVLSYDGSIDPHKTSQVAVEREQLRQSQNINSPQIDRPQQNERSLRLNQSTQKHNLSLPTTNNNSNPQLPSRYRSRRRGQNTSGLHSRSSSHSDTVVLQETSLNYSSFLETEDNLPPNTTTKTTNEEASKYLKWSWLSQKLFIIWLIFVTLLVIVLLVIPTKVAHFDLGCIPVAASILTMLMDTILNRKNAYDVMAKIDWAVILMFMGLFVWLRGMQNTTFPCLAFNSLKPYMNLNTFTGVLVFSIFVIIGSNIFSNVPLVILIANQVSQLCGEGKACEPLAGLLLAWVSTIAGNFTLIGSVANLIVAEKARKAVDYKLSFTSYLVFGFPSTLIIIYGCLPVVYFMGKHVANKVNE